MEEDTDRTRIKMKHSGLDYWTGREECIPHFSQSLRMKEITIKGIGQRASMDEICHKLQYMGHILENPVEEVWKIEEDDDDYLENVKNGDVSVKMVLDYEFNYLISGMTAYRVSYKGQAKQCGYCFSWKHSLVRDCPKKNQGTGREELLQSYYENWKKEVNYRKRPVLDVTVEEPVKKMRENKKKEEESGEGSENEFLEEKDGEDDCAEKVEDEEDDGVGNREEQEEEDEDEREEVDEAGEDDSEGEDADDDDEDGKEENSSCAGATTVDLEMTDDVSNVGVGDEDVTKESYYNRGVQRMDMEQQEMNERSSLDRAGVG